MKLLKNKKMTATKKFVKSNPEAARLFHQERAIIEATEMICGIMDRDGISRVELANRIGKTKPYITQLLGGETNMTIRTLSDVLLALGRTLHISSRR